MLLRIPWTTKPPLGTPIDKSNPLAQGLVGSWALNENGGSVLKDSAGKYDAALTSPVWGNNALTFGGSQHAAVTLPNLASYTILTIQQHGTDYYDIRSSVDQDDGGGNRIFQFRVEGPGTANSPVSFIPFDTSVTPYVITSTNSFPANVDYVMAATMTGKSANLYVNGILNGSTTMTANGAGITSNIPTWFGERYSVSQPFYGKMKLVLIYNRALSQKEIKEISINPWRIFVPKAVTITLPAQTALTFPYKSERVAKPPLGTPIDWSNPINKSLIGAWAFNERGGAYARNLVNNNDISFLNTPHWGVNGLTCDGASPNPNCLNAANIIAPANRQTFITIIKATNSGGNYLASPSWGYLFVPATDFRVYNGSAWSTSQNFNVVDGKIHIVAFVFDGNMSVYIDGILVYVQISYAIPALTNIQWGGRQASYPLGGDLNLGLVFSRPLRASEISAISANPWQIFQPRTIFLPGVASVLSGSSSFTIADSTSASTADNVTLSQASGAFTITDSTSATAADNVVLTQGGGTFSVADSTAATTADNVILTLGGTNTFVIQDSTAASTADNVSLVGNLIIADSTSATTADNVSLIGNLQVADSVSLTTADNVTLTLGGTNQFIVQDSTSATTADNMTLVQGGGTLAIQDSVSGSTSDNVSLIGNLIIQDSVSTSTADNVIITLAGTNVFAINDSVSASTADTVTIVQASGSFIISDSVSASTIDNVTLTQTLHFNLNPNVFVNTGDVAVQCTGLKIPVWDTGSRPPPVMGVVGFNTTLAKIEVYDGTTWR